MSLIKIFKHIGYLKQIRYTLHAIFFLITHATFWGAISIAVAFGFVFFALSRWVFTEERERRRREVREEREREKFAERSKVLVCSMDLKADTSTIPLSQKSVRLLYKELKRKVCRPFAS